MKDSDRAISTLADLVKDHPDHASAHYLLGRLLQARPGSGASARTHFERYVRLAPNGDKAAEVRQWLITH